jgi:hypothetical protein
MNVYVIEAGVNCCLKLDYVLEKIEGKRNSQRTNGCIKPENRENNRKAVARFTLSCVQ